MQDRWTTRHGFSPFFKSLLLAKGAGDLIRKRFDQIAEGRAAVGLDHHVGGHAGQQLRASELFLGTGVEKNADEIVLG